MSLALQSNSGDQQFENTTERDSPKARLGGISSDRLPEGEVKPQTVVIESMILGYRAAAEAARLIAQAVKAATATKVVFFSAKEIAAIAALRAFELQATTLTPPVVTADAVLQLLALTKSDRTATGASVTLNEFTMYALVSLELKSIGIAAAYPPLYHPAAFQGTEKGSRAEQILNGIVNQQASLDTAYATLEKLKVQVTKRLASEKRAACKPLFQANLQRFASGCDLIATMVKPVQDVGLGDGGKRVA